MTASGKFVLRVDPKLHLRLRKESERRGLSLNALCQESLSGGLGSEAFRVEIDSFIQLLGDDLLGVMLFGSQVDGSATDASDEDFLIVVDQRRPLSRALYSQWDEKWSKRFLRLSPHFVYLPDFSAGVGSLWLECAVNSRILWDPNQILKKTKEKVLGAILSGQYRRKLSHGHPYWIKESDEK